MNAADGKRQPSTKRLPAQAGLVLAGNTHKRRRQTRGASRIYDTRLRMRKIREPSWPSSAYRAPVAPGISESPSQASSSVGSEESASSLSPSASPPLSPSELSLELGPLPLALALDATVTEIPHHQKSFNFSGLPAELRVMILGHLVRLWSDSTQEREPMAPYASVSYEFQAAFEPSTFRRLVITPQKVAEFHQIVQNSRRRCVRRIDLTVQLPPYFDNPCVEPETLQDKLTNNAIFTECFRQLFMSLADWDVEEAHKLGIALMLSVASPSDMHHAPARKWQDRRWNPLDIGDKRFCDSRLDFLGQDEEARWTGLLPLVRVITSFRADTLMYRAVSPSAYAEIISRLPMIESSSLRLFKEDSLGDRKLAFDQLAALVQLWPASVEKLELAAPTRASWREIPHSALAEKDSGRALGGALLRFAMQLRALSIRNLIKVQDFLRPFWPLSDRDDHKFVVPPDCWALPKSPSDGMWFARLESLYFEYGTVIFDPNWRAAGIRDIQEDDALAEWRRHVSLAAARLAMRMPRLRHMVISQRPFMWLGRHTLSFKVGPHHKLASYGAMPHKMPRWRRERWDALNQEDAAMVLWRSTTLFTPGSRVLDAWLAVADLHKLDFGWKSIRCEADGRLSRTYSRPPSQAGDLA